MTSSLVFLGVCVMGAVFAAPQATNRQVSCENPHVVNTKAGRGVPVHSYRSHPPRATYAPGSAEVRPLAAGRNSAILRQAQDVNTDGSYSFGFETANGISVQTIAGPLSALGPDDGLQTVTGSFHYIAPDGSPISTYWIADGDGFRAEGDHLPRAPEYQY